MKTKLSALLIPLNQRTAAELEAQDREDQASVWWLVVFAIALVVIYTLVDRATEPQPDAMPTPQMNESEERP